MKREEVLELFKQHEAFLEGHFLLTSGLHSPHYFQCARVLQYPKAAKALGWSLGTILKTVLHGVQPDTVLSPAIGGLIIGHEVARYFKCRAIFSERVEGSMRIKRFDLGHGEKVIVVEDVVTTGGSLEETARLAEDAGAEVLAVGCLIDRIGASRKLTRELHSAYQVEVVTYQPEDCPLCKKGLPLVKPGSRQTPGKES